MNTTPSLSRREIAAGLRALGVPPGSKLLVHSSLSSLGHVEGGADAVIDAFLDVLGPAGTLLVPTLTGDETLSAANPPVFDPTTQPCWTGLIPETLRMTTFGAKRPGDTLNIEIERSTQVFVDTVRDALDERLGPLLPALEALLRERGLCVDELARPLPPPAS